MRRRLVVRSVLVALAVVLLAARPAAAHDLRPGVLAFRELGDGELVVRFVPSVDSLGETTRVTFELPAQCTPQGDRVRCDGAFAGGVTVRGMRGDAMKTLVVLERRDGSIEDWVATASSPRVDVGAAPPSTALPWIRIGVEHILGGPDHLAFVLGLLLVLRFTIDRRLLFTITSFTVAHSLTLALAALEVIAIPTPPVEACIAMSVLLVAREGTHRKPTAIRRWPWLAAAAFGLVHGLGFAAALGESGLPQGAIARSLLWFNVGVELGQLAVVAVLVGAVRLGARWVGERGAHVHRAACYVLGGLAAWWSIDRVVAML